MSDPTAGILLRGFEVDRSSPIPLYRQIETTLRRLILNGSLRPSTRMPSTRDLAAMLGVSRITIKSVYEQLVAEGYLEAKTGSGTFVAQGLPIEAGPEVAQRHQRHSNPGISLPDHVAPILASQASIRHGVTAPFRPGVPALDLFPVKLWNRYLQEASFKYSGRNLSYGELAGNSALRDAIARHLTDTRGMQVDADEIVITSGAQQAFVLIAFVLLNRGDTVWYEDPGHIAGRDVMRIMGANVAPVPLDTEGMNLAHAAREHPKPRAIFTTPSHQQPLGITMSLTRRLELLGYAAENDAWIIEDDYDSEFRYRGRPLPALSALDRTGRVLYVGTFSKSMFAAMRLGYIVVPRDLADAFAQAKTLLGQSSSPVVEQAMAGFMEDGRFIEHIRKMRRAYRDRRDALYQAISEQCAGLLTPQNSEAGMHMLAWLPEEVDDQAMHRALLDQGIESLALSVYSTQRKERPALVLGFAGVREDVIPKLVKRMAEVLQSAKQRPNSA